MDKITFDYSNIINNLDNKIFDDTKVDFEKAHIMLDNKSGLGNDYLGWLDLPNNYNDSDFEKINKCATKIRDDSDVLIVVGIGGSYLGSKAAIDMLTNNFKKDGPIILFAGNSLSSNYLIDLLDFVKDKNVSINVISKSGTTTEPALAFRFLRGFMLNKYGIEGSKERIYVTTDKSKGSLKALADKEGYSTFVIPDDIGGRFSILTAVGLLPIAVAGIDIKEVIKGAQQALIDFKEPTLEFNYCYQYALMRNVLYRSGKKIEIFGTYEPSMECFTKWWQQLFAESEGKAGKGIFPVPVTYSTELHSLGQYIQEGERTIFETIVHITEPNKDLKLHKLNDDIEGFNYLADKTINYVNDKALLGTVKAHMDGDVPNLIINIPKINAYYFGYLIYFFEKACAISSYMLGVNPFNQPGVEAYKKNMFRLLNKQED